jgi:hypothetical protein
MKRAQPAIVSVEAITNIIKRMYNFSINPYNMKIIKKTALLALLFFGSLNYSAAQEFGKQVSPLRFLVAGALEFGGDEVAEVYFTNGNTQSVRAGQGGTIAVGGQYQFAGAEKFLLRATVGYKYVTTEADNVHIRMTRVPIQLTANYMAAKKLLLSAGFVMHRAIRFNSGGIGNNIRFKPANGSVIGISYAGIGVTYTTMRYRNEFNDAWSANAIGVAFSITIPNR